jgi:hypothetical protein
MNETPQATRGQCGLETRWVERERGTGRLPGVLASGLAARPNPDASPLARPNTAPVPSLKSCSCDSGGRFRI